MTPTLLNNYHQHEEEQGSCQQMVWPPAPPPPLSTDLNIMASGWDYMKREEWIGAVLVGLTMICCTLDEV